MSRVVPTLAIIIPTVTGREAYLQTCIDTYLATLEESLVVPRIIVITDADSAGAAWNAGTKLVFDDFGAQTDYLHLTADDIEPQPGWLEAAMAVVDTGAVPAPLVVNGKGELESCGVWGRVVPNGTPVEMSVLPFMAGDDWREIGPIPPIHYFCDNCVSTLLTARLGRQHVVCHGYAFRHTWAQEKRKPMIGEVWQREANIWLDLKRELELS